MSGDDEIDIQKWSKIVLLLSMVLATLYGVDSGVVV
jgi:hypothetical protein